MEFYLIGIVVDELLLVVTSVALVNDAKKFDVNCEANALISIDETLISGPTKINTNDIQQRKSFGFPTSHNPTNICNWLLIEKIIHRYM